MNIKLWVCVSVLVAVGYLAVFRIIDRWRTMGETPRVIPDPTFNTTTIRYQNDSGQDVKVVREYTVKTQFADEATLKSLPPPPAQPAGK